jgi:simple sugar transport system permease protein/ribose transport system permease protein
MTAPEVSMMTTPGGAASVVDPAAVDLPGWRERFLAPGLAVTAVLVLLVVAKITTPEFLTADNFLEVVRAASLTGIAALGMTFITIARYYFSLSVEQTAALAAIVFALLMKEGLPIAPAIAAALATAAVVGLAQGLVVARGANPIITTLGAGAALFGLAAVLTDNHTVYISDKGVDFLATGTPLGLPTQTWAFLILTVLAAVVLNQTRIGRTVTFVGANPDAARTSGMSVGRAALFVFAVSATAGGIVGIFVASTAHQGVVNQVPGLNFDAVAAVLVGGTAIQGGDGSMIRTTLGAIFITLLQNLAVIRGYGAGPQIFMQGMAIVLAVAVFSLIRRATTR